VHVIDRNGVDSGENGELKSVIVVIVKFRRRNEASEFLVYL
jgi:hypothetical protein